MLLPSPLLYHTLLIALLLGMLKQGYIFTSILFYFPLVMVSPLHCPFPFLPFPSLPFPSLPRQVYVMENYPFYSSLLIEFLVRSFQLNLTSDVGVILLFRVAKVMSGEYCLLMYICTCTFGTCTNMYIMSVCLSVCVRFQVFAQGGLMDFIQTGLYTNISRQ